MKIVKKIKKLFNKMLKKDKWKLHLYYRGQVVKKMFVDDDFLPMEHFYTIKLRRCKHLIGTNKKTILLFQYYKYKMTDNEKKELHIEVIINEGSDLTL